MNISGIGANTGSAAGAPGMLQKEDSVTRMLKRQLANEQKKLQELAGNSNLSMEEKAKKRQEIQKQIAELNRQLREHQNQMRREEAEKAKEKQQQKYAEREAQKENGKAKDGEAAGFSKGSMQALVSADAAVEQARVQGSVSDRMEGRAGVLEIEIKLDKDRGGQAERKEAELAEVKEKALQAESAQLGTLKEAQETLKEAGKEERETAGSTPEKEKETEEKKDKTKRERKEEEYAAEATEADGRERRYKKMDVRL